TPGTADWGDKLKGSDHGTVANGQWCSDANYGNGAESCMFGLCLHGTPIDCSDGNPCTVDTCDSASGCHYAVAADGSSCDDGNACNGTEVCQAGVCNAGTTLGCD